jgi:hypothetical protein
MTFFKKNSCDGDEKTRAANSTLLLPIRGTSRDELMGEGVLCASQTNWLSQALESLSQIPQPKRGPRRNDTALLNAYLNIIKREVTLNQRRKDQILLNIYHIRRDKIKRQLGKFTNGKTVIYWLDWFEQQSWSLYSVVNTGSKFNEENTQVTLHFDFLTDLELESVSKETLIEHYDQLNKADPSNVMGTPIDTQSLELFIERCRESLRTQQRYNKKYKRMDPAHPDWLKKVKENLKHAVQILRLTENGELIQPLKSSDFGRMYLGGLNLQSCSSTVRHAALGHCYSIDFSVCSTAWRLYTAQQIDPTFVATQTLRLIKDKQQFRWDVAKVLGDKHISYAKTLLTSIGFGADINSKPWPMHNGQAGIPAVKEIIDDEQLEALQSTDWFMQFIAEQTAMTKIITDDVLKNTDKKDLVDCVKDAAGKIQRNKIMAYLYQHAEAEYLTTLLDYIVTNFGRDEILLAVHDCVYIKHSINLAHVNGLLQQLNPYLQAERTEHWGHFDERQQPAPTIEVDAHQQQANSFIDYWNNKNAFKQEGFYEGYYGG